MRSEILSASLNSKMILPPLCNANISRDWNGIATLLNINKNNQNLVQQSSDKMLKLIEIWIVSYPDPDIKSLLENLQRIERYDVYDDIVDFMGLPLWYWPSETSSLLFDYFSRRCKEFFVHSIVN